MHEGKLYWLVAADYERTKAEFNYICEYLERIPVRFQSTKNIDPGEIEIEGGFRIVTKSAKDPRKLAMEAPDGIVGCEASQLDYESFLRLRGRLAERRGWMLLSGTFESSLGWYPDLWQQGQLPNPGFASFSIPTWSNLAIFPGGRDDPEIKALEEVSSVEWFSERFGGVPCPPKGRVFSEFSNPIHTGTGDLFEFDPSYDVQLWVDPGYASVYAVEVVQQKGEQIYVIDEVYESGLITSDMITLCKQKQWWHKVVGGAIDIAGTQHQAMPAPTEIWIAEGNLYLLPQRLLIRDGIELVKRYLLVNPLTQSPKIHINSKCKGLISEMGGCASPIDNQTKVYKWKMDREDNVIGEIPDDKHNHACKALAYGLSDLVGFTETKKKGKIIFW